jgi:hypothetical protein
MIDQPTNQPTKRLVATTITPPFSPAAAAAGGVAGVGPSSGGLPALGSWRQALVQPTAFYTKKSPGQGQGGMAVTANGKRGKVKAALVNVMDEGPMRCVRLAFGQNAVRGCVQGVVHTATATVWLCAVCCGSTRLGLT